MYHKEQFCTNGRLVQNLVTEWYKALQLYIKQFIVGTLFEQLYYKPMQQRSVIFAFDLFAVFVLYHGAVLRNIEYRYKILFALVSLFKIDIWLIHKKTFDSVSPNN